MTFCLRYRLATILLSLGVLLSDGSSAQDSIWREQAAREARRAADVRRAELIRRQYERRRSAAHARMRLEDDSSLFASTPSSTDAQLSCPALPVSDTGSVLDRFFSQRSDGTLLIDIGDGTSGIGLRTLGAAPPWWPDRLAPILRGSGTGPEFAAAHAGLLASPGWDAQSAAGGVTVHSIPLFPSVSDAHGRQGIVQVRNGSDRAGEVRIVAVDDSGREYGPLSLFLEANGMAHVTSHDLENGNPDKRLYGGTGPGVGDWRLELSSDVEIEAQSFVRTWDGALMPMHDTVASEGTRHNVPIFHPSSQWEQESRLRLINPGDVPAAITIMGIDSHGQSPGSGVSVTIPAGASLTYTAAELETGNGAGMRGSLGEGTGEWRLVIESEQSLQVMNLMSSPTVNMGSCCRVGPLTCMVADVQVGAYGETYRDASRRLQTFGWSTPDPVDTSALCFERRSATKNKIHSPEFKDEAVRQIADRGYSVAEASISTATYALSFSTLALKNSKSSVLLNGNRRAPAENSIPR